MRTCQSMCAPFLPPCHLVRHRTGVSQHPKGTTNKQSSSLAYLVSVCSATERGPPAASAPSGTGSSSLFLSHSSLGASGERAETARGVEVEEEGWREEERDDAAGPGSGPVTPNMGMCHTGSPKRCFFFFTGLRGVSLRRSSSASDSSISSSAEIRISDSDSSWDAALR